MLVLDASSAPSARPRLTVSNGEGTWYHELNGTRFEIHRSGSGLPAELRLQPDGDLIIGGTLTELSSRSAKKDFAVIDPVEVLERLIELPVLSWQYKDNESGARHVGPMAEDFFAAFRLGTGETHISPSDKAGIALLAIQGLRGELTGRDARIAELKARNATLERRMAEVERRLAALSSPDAPSAR
jgi:hypothetical protein